MTYADFGVSITVANPNAVDPVLAAPFIATGGMYWWDVLVGSHSGSRFNQAYLGFVVSLKVPNSKFELRPSIKFARGCDPVVLCVSRHLLLVDSPYHSLYSC